MTSMTEIFGEPISVYTRKQAIEDGDLADVTEWAGGVFNFPVAFTQALYYRLTRGAGGKPATLKARIWDVCYMATVGTAKVDGPDSMYPVIVGRETLHLRMNCGPGDHGEPVMTCGFPEDF
jgi:hypothetical protein